MSTAKRLISGSASSWARIGVTMLTQLALVPVFLTYWDVKTYGIWIAIQAIVNMLSTLDRGFNDYMQYELLKIGVKDRSQMASLLWSGVFVIMIISLIELVIVCFIAFYADIEYFLGDNKFDKLSFRQQVSWSLVIQWVIWMFTNFIGLFFRSLCCFGYYPRMGWWNVILAIISSLAPVVAVMNGADLLVASIWSMIGSFLVLLLQYLDVRRQLEKEQLTYTAFSIKEGFKNYIDSLGLSCRYFLENFRHQGVRLVLAPLSGASGLAAFATMRTGANVALQGLSTITSPLMPELMRFLHQGEQKKTEAAFDTVWMVLVAGLAPAVLILQAVVPSLFTIWTKGQISFDPPLFATLSLGVLVYAWSQPAAAIITGNNLIKIQLLISVLSSVFVIGGMFLLIPYLGLLGSGVSLLVAEIVAAIGFQHFAKQWMQNHSLSWPVKSANLAFISVLITAMGMFTMIMFPFYKWLLLSATFFLQVWNIRMYWDNLPQIAIDKTSLLLRRIPFISKVYKM